LQNGLSDTGREGDADETIEVSADHAWKAPDFIVLGPSLAAFGQMPASPVAMRPGSGTNLG
jgi:hypothetical protein